MVPSLKSLGLHIRDSTYSMQHLCPGERQLSPEPTAAHPPLGGAGYEAEELRPYPCEQDSNASQTQLEGRARPDTIFPCSRKPGWTEASRTMALGRQCADSPLSKGTDGFSSSCVSRARFGCGNRASEAHKLQHGARHSRPGHRQPVTVVVSSRGSTWIITPIQELCVGDSRALTWRPERKEPQEQWDSLVTWGVLQGVWGISLVLSESLTLVWLPGFFRATMLPNSEGCYSYHSGWPWIWKCCLILEFCLSAWSLRIRKLSAWI